MNQILHTTGGDWFPVKAPNPVGKANRASNVLFAVRCTSATNCWAVGYAQRANAARKDQILHWNGMKWTAASAPAPGGTSKGGDINQLNDVSCTSAKDCWAVGRYGFEKATTTSDSEVDLTQVLHWTGKKWSLVSSPDPAGRSQNQLNVLHAVRCASAKDCWAAGSDGLRGKTTIDRNLMLHWNGTKWAPVKVPNPAGTANLDLNQLQSLGCTSTTNCWAVGSYGKSIGSHRTLDNQALRWTGRKWVKVKTPNPDGGGPDVRNQLNAVTCTTASDCWAVGLFAGIDGRPGLNQALHWGGTDWSVANIPNPGGTTGDVENDLLSIRCTSSANCWAVGTVEKNVENDDQFLHWNGAKWQF